MHVPAVRVVRRALVEAAAHVAVVEAVEAVVEAAEAVAAVVGNRVNHDTRGMYEH